MTALHLTKHHGLGNDFLVLLDPDGATTVTSQLAQALCDRRTGIGADGLLHAVKAGDGADLELTVWNADGSIAETSGNGLRCLAQAAVDSAIAPLDILVRTGGATRHLRVEPETALGLRQVSVGMGIVRPGGDEPAIVKTLASRIPATRAARADAGNPHLVVLTDDLTDLEDLFMRMMSTSVAGEPLNLEAIRIESGHIRMRVWERGVGETMACGSGSVAAAAVARNWGLVGDEVDVRSQGGTVSVRLGPDGEATLTGPAKFIGRVEVDSDRISP